MSLKVDKIPRGISPPRLCTPSRIIGEKLLSAVLREVENPELLERVLDVGCGGGEYRFLFPGCIYTGLDIVDASFSEKMNETSSFAIASANDLPIKGDSQNFVFSFYSFEYFPDPHCALEEMFRVLKPGGLVILCLPTRWVLSYDWFANILRRMGIRLGQVSAQPGIHYYTPCELTQLASDSEFVVKQIIPVYGWALLLLKSVSSWFRIVTHLSCRLLRRLSKEKFQKRMPLYASRQVHTVLDEGGLQKVQIEQMKKMTYIDKFLYRLTLLCHTVDKLSGNKPVVEYITVLIKPEEST